MLATATSWAARQRGNNNAYCQDNEVTWIDWSSAGASEDAGDFLEFVRRLLALRRQLDLDEPPVALSATGSELGDGSKRRLPLCALWRAETGLLVLLNGTDRARRFRLPPHGKPTGSAATDWRVLLSSAEPNSYRLDHDAARVPARSLLVVERAGGRASRSQSRSLAPQSKPPACG